MEATKRVTTEEKYGSNQHPAVETVHGKPADHVAPPPGAADISPATFSTYFTWRGNGGKLLNCPDGRITANSRVFASISEYNTDPRQNRFVGNAGMSIFNVSPYNGGVVVWLSVNWSSPLNVRVDLLVDPSWV